MLLYKSNAHYLIKKNQHHFIWEAKFNSFWLTSAVAPLFLHSLYNKKSHLELKLRFTSGKFAKYSMTFFTLKTKQISNN